MLSINAKAQRFSLPDIVSAAYKDYATTDTFNYLLDELYPFFDTTRVYNKGAHLKCFRNTKNFISNLSNSKDSYLLEINVVKISCGSIILNLSLSLTNLQWYTNNTNMRVLGFVNERQIECILKGKEWKFQKVLKNKSHASDDWDTIN